MATTIAPRKQRVGVETPPPHLCASAGFGAAARTRASPCPAAPVPSSRLTSLSGSTLASGGPRRCRGHPHRAERAVRVQCGYVGPVDTARRGRRRGRCRAGGVANKTVKLPGQTKWRRHRMYTITVHAGAYPDMTRTGVAIFSPFGASRAVCWSPGHSEAVPTTMSQGRGGVLLRLVGVGSRPRVRLSSRGRAVALAQVAVGGLIALAVWTGFGVLWSRERRSHAARSVADVRVRRTAPARRVHVWP